MERNGHFQAILTPRTSLHPFALPRGKFIEAGCQQQLEMENSSSCFDMSSLQSELPNHRRGGLSRWYSGKSRSFTCMDDVKCIADLKKPELPEAKAKKYSSRQGLYPPPVYRRKSPCTNRAG